MPHSEKARLATSHNLKELGVLLPQRGAARELTSETAVVQVASNVHGVVRGSLQWAHFPEEDVTFALLEIKPGYAVVGEVSAGPDLFRKVCWKLKSLNGRSWPGPHGIAKNDRLVLEGPRWVTERLVLQDRTFPAPLPRTGLGTAAAPPGGTQTSGMAAPHTHQQGPRLMANAAQFGPPVTLPAVPAAAVAAGLECEGTDISFDVVTATRHHQARGSAHAVPRLDLTGMQGPQGGPHPREGKRHDARGPGGCEVTLGQCGELWQCI